MDAMERIRSQRGLMARLAAELGVTRGAVAVWKRVPASRLREVAAFTGIPPHELRPDLAAHFAETREHAAPGAVATEAA